VRGRRFPRAVLWSGIGHDVRTAARRLAGQPASTTFTILTLALAIGVAAALFSVVDQLLLRPPPFLHADRLVNVMSQTGANRSGGSGLTAEKILGWQQQPAVFERLEGSRAADPALVPAAVRAQIRELDPNLPVGAFASGTELYARPVAEQQFVLTVMGAFAGTALLLTAMGIFGVLSQAVTRRRREIGIRRALGAGNPRLIRMLVGRGAAASLLKIHSLTFAIDHNGTHVGRLGPKESTDGSCRTAGPTRSETWQGRRGRRPLEKRVAAAQCRTGHHRLVRAETGTHDIRYLRRVPRRHGPAGPSGRSDRRRADGESTGVARPAPTIEPLDILAAKLSH
jgi:hypothetical protein